MVRTNKQANTLLMDYTIQQGKKELIQGSERSGFTGIPLSKTATIVVFDRWFYFVLMQRLFF